MAFARGRSGGASAVVRPDGHGDGRGGGAEGGAVDAVVAAPGAVFALDLREPDAHLLVPLHDLRVALCRLLLRGHHVRDVLLASVGPESPHQPLVRELIAYALRDLLRLELHVPRPFPRRSRRGGYPGGSDDAARSGIQIAPAAQTIAACPCPF